MPGAPEAFELALSYPQWQGSGRHENLLRGAQALASLCARYAPVASVPLAGDGRRAEGVNRWTAILEQFQSARDLLARGRPAKVLTAGGDCAVDVAVIDYLLGIHPDLTVVWVDAHLDANTADTSPSGDFHGMPVAALMGKAPEAMRRLLGAPLRPNRFRYVAADVGDPGDWAFQRAKQLQWLGPDESIDGPVHIHFDLDVLDPGEFPHLAYKDGRMTGDDGVALVRRLAGNGRLVGLTITEFAPADEADAAAGLVFIERLCRAALGPAAG